MPTTTLRYHHNWYDTDHGSAILDWCHRKHIDTHPQRRKPRSPASFTSLRKARNISKRLQHHLFQTRLRHTAGHQLTVTHPTPTYGHKSRLTAVSARTRRRRTLRSGLSSARVHRLQRRPACTRHSEDHPPLIPPSLLPRYRLSHRPKPSSYDRKTSTRPA